MIIIAGYTRTDAEKRNDAVEAFRDMVERARAYDGCLDFSIGADAVDPERVNLFECWRDQTTLNAWRKVARGGPRAKPKEITVSLYRTDKAEKPFQALISGDEKMNTDSKTTREIVDRFNNAFKEHRPEDLDDLIGEGCVLENTAPAPDGARYEGREACLDFWKGIASSANLVFEVEEIWTSADRGIIRWLLRWSESEADRVRGVNIMRVRGRKIVEGLGYVKG